ncbi:hypothetical protein GCM10010841_32610 [Deinococcus aerophilus]|uniref:Peptidase S8/S53 domain-containing protein n=2 Tax=Deinococcus aerophilus TaxID=522488 RepID=A0ABQ2H176_9DEIO|nr:hypothetical protein GCM10010841_32610 [Deinococcus aerophilus]
MQGATPEYYFVQEIDVEDGVNVAQFTEQRQKEYPAGSAIIAGAADTGTFDDRHTNKDKCDLFSCDLWDIFVKISVTVR